METNSVRVRLRAIRTALTVLTCFAPTLARAITEQEARSQALRVASAAALTYDSRSAVATRTVGARQEAKWTVSSGETMIVIDDADGRLRIALDALRDRRIRQRIGRTGARFYMVDETAWTRAESVLADLGRPAHVVRHDLRYVPDEEHRDPNERGRVALRFWASPYGYPPNGNGNKAIVTLDSQEGSVVAIETSYRWQYPAPDIRITENRAREIAEGVLGTVARSYRVSLNYYQPGDGWESVAGPVFLAQRVCRLCFCVYGTAGTVLVDAQTGKILGGGRAATGRGPGRGASSGTPSAPQSGRITRKPDKDLPATVKAFLAAIRCPVSTWSTRLTEVRDAKSVTYVKKPGYPTSYLYVREGKVYYALFQAPYTPNKKIVVKTRRDAVRYVSSLMEYYGLTSFGLKSFEVGSPLEREASATKGKVARFTGTATDAQGRKRRVKVTVSSETGMLVFWYVDWPR